MKRKKFYTIETFSDFVKNCASIERNTKQQKPPLFLTPSFGSWNINKVFAKEREIERKKRSFKKMKKVFDVQRRYTSET